MGMHIALLQRQTALLWDEYLLRKRLKISHAVSATTVTNSRAEESSPAIAHQKLGNNSALAVKGTVVNRIGAPGNINRGYICQGFRPVFKERVHRIIGDAIVSEI